MLWIQYCNINDRNTYLVVLCMLYNGLIEKNENSCHTRRFAIVLFLFLSDFILLITCINVKIGGMALHYIKYLCFMLMNIIQWVANKEVGIHLDKKKIS